MTTSGCCVMPGGGETRPDLLVDTSVAVALVVVDHESHGAAANALRGRRLGLAGHAAFETYSVLTRLPPPLRLTPAAAVRVLAENFPASRFLGVPATRSLLREMAGLGIAGGAVYDALIGAAAAEHRVRLATRDVRALETYRAVSAEVDLLS